MPTVFPDKLGRRRLKRLLNAHEEKAFEGTIPWDCAEAIAAHEQIDRDFQTANFAAWLARHAAKIELRAALRAEQATKAPWAEAEGENT